MSKKLDSLSLPCSFFNAASEELAKSVAAPPKLLNSIVSLSTADVIVDSMANSASNGFSALNVVLILEAIPLKFNFKFNKSIPAINE